MQWIFVLCGCMFLLSLIATYQVCTVSLKAGLYTYKALEPTFGCNGKKIVGMGPMRGDDRVVQCRRVDHDAHPEPARDATRRGGTAGGNSADRPLGNQPSFPRSRPALGDIAAAAARVGLSRRTEHRL